MAGRLTFLNFLARTGIADLRPEQFELDVARRLRRTQINDTMSQMRVMLPSNTFFAPALSYQAWGAGVNLQVIVWTLVMLVFSWWLIWSWKTAYPSDSSQRDMDRFVLETYVNSGLWAVGFMLFFPVVSGDQKAILAAIMAGSLAIGTIGFSKCPAAAFAYANVQIIGNSGTALMTGLVSGNPNDFVLAFLCFTAGLSLLNAVTERGKATIAAFKDHESLAEKTEVIDLLLKDYEEQSTQWVWQTDADGHIVRAPTKVLELLGLDPDEVRQTTFLQAVIRTATEDSEGDIHKLRDALDGQVEFHDVTISLRDPGTGDLRWIIMKGRPQIGDRGFDGFRGIFADGTATIEAKRQVQYLATHDSLTDLSNRNAIKRHLASLKPETDHAAGILIDLDGFKLVNDSYGHQVGDRLLEEVADRLKAVAPPGSLIARLGGDEFFVLYSATETIPVERLSDAADQIVESLSQIYKVEDYDLQISASVGIAQYPLHTRVGPDLLLMADMALYEAKNNGRNRSEFFHADLQEALNSRLALTDKLKIAVEQRQITPYYQSQHSLSDGRLLGFEALARWYDDELGSVGPDIFIPIAEQTGLIVELGEQILHQACLDARNWVNMMPGGDFVVSVNFSPIQFNRSDVVATVARTLQDTGLPPQHLEIEVTEGVLISDRQKIASTLTALSDLGVSIALDDFGTGYSSLSYLKDLPLNRLKIDQSFVINLSADATNSIVEAVVQLGESLGMTVIPEGIEDETQRRRLFDLGCADGQGYLFGRPLPAAGATQVVQAAAKAALPWSA